MNHSRRKKAENEEEDPLEIRQAFELSRAVGEGPYVVAGFYFFGNQIQLFGGKEFAVRFVGQAAEYAIVCAGIDAFDIGLAHGKGTAFVQFFPPKLTDAV